MVGGGCGEKEGCACAAEVAAWRARRAWRACARAARRCVAWWTNLWHSPDSGWYLVCVVLDQFVLSCRVVRRRRSFHLRPGEGVAGKAVRIVFTSWASGRERASSHLHYFTGFPAFFKPPRGTRVKIQQGTYTLSLFGVT